MQGYVALKKKKSKLGKTLTTVAIFHIIIGGGLVWLASTQAGRELMTVYKLTLKNIYEPPPPPEVKSPELPPPPEKEEPAKPPEPEPPPQEALAPEPPPANESPVESAPSGEPPPIKLPAFGSAVGGGEKKGKFAGYADLVTVELQRLYKQPTDLPDDSNMTVQLQILLDADGSVLSYRLVRSSGNEKFDQSALQALGKLQRLHPPPQGMSHTLVVKFYHKLFSS